MNVDPSNPVEFLKLPKAQRRKLLTEQAEEVAHLYASSSELLEWTEDYAEDEPRHDPLTQTR